LAVVSAGPYANLHLAPDRYPFQHPTTQFFTGRVLFLSPIQQRQSTEGIRDDVIENYGSLWVIRRQCKTDVTKQALYCVCVCVCPAVREDRTPGGKHRAKKLRGDETSDVSPTSGSSGPVVMDWNGYEQEELLLSRLVDTRPDTVNRVEGLFGKHFPCILKSLF